MRAWQKRIKLRGKQPPAPVARRLRRPVHAARAVEAEYILRRQHRDLRDGGERHMRHYAAHILPRDLLPSIGGKIYPLAHRGTPAPPADGGIVVMRPSIDGTARPYIMRRVGVIRDVAAKGEHQHLHSRKGKILHQRAHVVRDDSQILGDERQFLRGEAALGAKGLKHLTPQRGTPAAVLRQL